jgi:DnaJ like chaperone protein
MIYGKIVAGLIGFLTGGLLGMAIGIVIGHAFDKGLARTLQFGTPENLALVQDSFFETTFMLLGHLAKADGRISQQEVDHTEQIIAQMGLNSEQRRSAIALFRQGAAAGFQLDATISAFNRTCGKQRQLQQTLLWFLISLALADNHRIDNTETVALLKIAALMGFARPQFEQLLHMAQAQEHFHQGADQSRGQSPDSRLRDAYAALGVTREVSDQELKRAYRKRMSENHPDKLIARGVPEHMVKLATEKSQEIQSAYEMLREHRASGHT